MPGRTRRIAIAAEPELLASLAPRLTERYELDVIDEAAQFDGGDLVLVDPRRADAAVLLERAAGAEIASLVVEPPRPEPTLPGEPACGVAVAALRAEAYVPLEVARARDPFDCVRPMDLRARSAGPLRLTYVGGDALATRDGRAVEIGATTNLVSPRTLIGRTVDAVVVLGASRVARVHAVITSGDELTIEDYDSTNGTWVRGARGLRWVTPAPRPDAVVPAERRVPLAPGDDVIIAGVYRLRLEGRGP